MAISLKAWTNWVRSSPESAGPCDAPPGIDDDAFDSTDVVDDVKSWLMLLFKRCAPVRRWWFCFRARPSANSCERAIVRADHARQRVIDGSATAQAGRARACHGPMYNDGAPSCLAHMGGARYSRLAGTVREAEDHLLVVDAPDRIDVVLRAGDGACALPPGALMGERGVGLHSCGCGPADTSSRDRHRTLLAHLPSRVRPAGCSG